MVQRVQQNGAKKLQFAKQNTNKSSCGIDVYYPGKKYHVLCESEIDEYEDNIIIRYPTIH